MRIPVVLVVCKSGERVVGYALPPEMANYSMDLSDTALVLCQSVRVEGRTHAMVIGRDTVESCTTLVVEDIDVENWKISSSDITDIEETE